MFSSFLYLPAFYFDFLLKAPLSLSVSIFTFIISFKACLFNFELRDVSCLYIFLTPKILKSAIFTDDVSKFLSNGGIGFLCYFILLYVEPLASLFFFDLPKARQKSYLYLSSKVISFCYKVLMASLIFVFDF